MIISGELQAGDGLPSIRTLAKDLRISVITTKRAYNDLEQEGFIATITGKGSFVHPDEGTIEIFGKDMKTCGKEIKEDIGSRSIPKE